MDKKEKEKGRREKEYCGYNELIITKKIQVIFKIMLKIFITFIFFI